MSFLHKFCIKSNRLARRNQDKRFTHDSSYNLKRKSNAAFLKPFTYNVEIKDALNITIKYLSQIIKKDQLQELQKENPDKLEKRLLNILGLPLSGRLKNNSRLKIQGVPFKLPLLLWLPRWVSGLRKLLLLKQPMDIHNLELFLYTHKLLKRKTRFERKENKYLEKYAQAKNEHSLFFKNRRLEFSNVIAQNNIGFVRRLNLPEFPLINALRKKRRLFKNKKRKRIQSKFHFIRIGFRPKKRKLEIRNLNKLTKSLLNRIPRPTKVFRRSRKSLINSFKFRSSLHVKARNLQDLQRVHRRLSSKRFMRFIEINKRRKKNYKGKNFRSIEFDPQWELRPKQIRVVNKDLINRDLSHSNIFLEDVHILTCHKKKKLLSKLFKNTGSRCLFAAVTRRDINASLKY